MNEGRRGVFVTLEGGEGAGKTTVARLLVERLQAANLPAVATREPGGTPLGELIRQLLRKPALARRFYAVLDDESRWTHISPLAELLLFSAARAQHVDTLIAPALAAGTHVVCDRYVESTLAYQGHGRGLPREQLAAAIALATRGLRSDLVVLLDVPVEIGLARKRGEAGRDQIGGESYAFHERVRQGYLALAREEPERWLVLDGCRAPVELVDAIWQRFARLAAARGWALAE
jgi:dTMP kinase